MKTFRFLGLALIAALCAVSTASAQMATPVPNTKPDFSPLKFLIGTWQCKTVKNTNGRGTGRTETDTYAMSLDDHYMMQDSISKPFDKARTTAIVSKGYVAYDAATKTWYSYSFDNFGDFGMSTSSGMSGNEWRWTDKWNSGGDPLGVAVITKVSDTKTTSTYTVKTPKGTEASSDECTKG
jgi:hypothetical protein